MEGDGYCAVRRRAVNKPVGDEKPLIQRMLGKELALPQQVYRAEPRRGRCFYCVRVCHIISPSVAAKYLGQLKVFGLTALTSFLPPS